MFRSQIVLAEFAYVWQVGADEIRCRSVAVAQ